MNDEIVKFKLTEHEEKINKNAKDINNLKLENTTQNGKIDNLCDKMGTLSDSIKGLVSTLKWGLGLGATALVPIFIYIISNLK